MKKNNPNRVFFLILAAILIVTALPIAAMADSLNVVEAQKLTPQEKAAVEFKEEVLRLTNVERNKAGLAPLKALEGLDELAQVRAEEIKVLFSHTRPGGEKWFTVFKGSELKYRKAGENLAFGFKKPADLVKAWMNSKSHRANILNPEFEHLGVGFFKDANGRTHVSQLFFTAAPTKANNGQ